jgi:hypothetical protein
MIELPDQKIENIIPAPAELFAVEHTDEGEPVLTRIVAYALTVDMHGEQSVMPLASDCTGDVAPSFCSIVYDPGLEEAERRYFDGIKHD